MSKNIYIDSTFTEESVSGQTSIYTGEELVWGVNAFATLNAASEAYDTDGTIYLSNTTLSAEYIPQAGYNLFLDKVTAAAITGAAGTTVETLSGVTAASIVGFDKVTITADQMLNVTDALSADTLEIKGDLAQRVLVKAGSIDFTDVPESIGLNVTANGSFVVNKTGKVYLGNQGVYDTRNGQARYNDYLFLDNGVNEVANTAYSLSNAKALAGADGTVVMTADLSKSGKVFAEGFKFAVSGAQVDTLYGDGVAAAAARAELTVSGTSSQVKNIYAAYKGITGDSLITVSDTTVAGVIDGSDSKVAGDSKLVLSGRVNAGTVTGFNTITIDGTGALVLTGAFDAAGTNITIDASQYTGASKKLVKGASVTVNSDLINFIAGEEGQQIVVGTDYIAITTNKVVEAFVNGDWNSSNVPDTYGDSMLTWNVNAFNNVTDALAALEENGQALYLVGGSITGDVNASNYALTIDNTDVNGSITGNGGTMVLKGSSEITGSLTNISSITWTPENGDVFTVGEGTVSANMTIDASKYVLAEDQLLQIVDADLAYRLEQVSDIKRGGENVYRKIVTSTITVNGTNYAVAVGDTGVYLRDFTHLNNRTYYSLNWSAADTGTRIGDDVIYFDRNARTTLSALCNDNTAVGGIITCYLNDNQTLNFEQDKLLSGFVVNGGTVNNFRSGKNGATDPVNFGRTLTFNNVLIATGGDRWLGAGTNWTRTRTRLDTGAYAAGGMQRQYGNIDLIVNGGTTSGSSNNFRMFTWTQMWGDANITFTGTRLDSDFQGIGDVSFEGIWDGDTFVRNAQLNLSFIDCTSVNGKWYGARSGGWATEDSNTFGQLVDINFTFQNTRITGSRISTNRWTDGANWTQGTVVFDVTASYLGDNISATDNSYREDMATWREKVINVHYDAKYDNNNSYITNAHWFNIVNIEAAARLRGETFNFHKTDETYAQAHAIESLKDQATGIQNAINVNAEGYTGKSKIVFQYGTVNNGDTVQVSVTGSELYDAYFTKDFTTVALLEKNSDVYFNAGYSTDAPVSELDGVSVAFVGGATDESLGNAVASLSEAKDLVDGRTGAKIIFTGDSREEAEALELDAEGYTLQVSGGSVTELIGAGSSADSVNLIVDGRAAVDKITVATATVSGDATVTLDGATIGGNVNGSDAKVAGTSELKLFNTTTVEGSVSGFNTITVDATAKLYAQSVNATNIQIDVADYTGSSCLISSVTGTITGNVSVINNSEGIYSARIVSGNKLFLISSVPTDTYFNTSWDSSIENTEYNGTVLVWNNNAFNSAADAFGVTNKDVYMVGGTQADALDTGAVNFIVDATTYGVASLNSLSGSGKLTLNGTATFAAGATISGYSELNFTVTADTCLTLDAITLADGGTLTIDASAITDFAGQTYTLVSTANGITASNLRVSGGAFGVYNSGSEILLVKTNNLYLDANFDASISGTVNETTGEIMYFGANAFNTEAALRTGTLSNGKIYVTQDGEKTLGTSIYGGNGGYDMEVVGVNASTVYAGNHNNAFVSDEDHTVIIKNSNLASVRPYALGGANIKQVINGKTTLVIEDSVISGQVHGTLGEGDNSVVNAEVHGDIDMTIRNTSMGPGFITFGEVGKATKDEDGVITSIDERINANVVLDKVVASDNFYGIRFNDHNGENPQVMAFDKVAITITGYRGTGFYGICEWVGGTDRPVGNFFGNFDVSVSELNLSGAFQLLMTEDRMQVTEGIPVGESKVVLKNVEGYSTSNTVGGRMCGMADLVLENGVSLRVNDYLSVNAAMYSGVEGKTNDIKLAFDSVLSVANDAASDTVEVDVTGYTGGNFMVMEAGSITLNYDYNDGRVITTGDSQSDYVIFSTAYYEGTGDNKVRVFIMDTQNVSDYIYVNIDGFDGRQATQVAATGEYLFNNYYVWDDDRGEEFVFTNSSDYFDTYLLEERQAQGFYVTGGNYGDYEMYEDVDTVIGGGTFNTLTVSEAIDLSMDNGLIGTLTMDGGSFVLNGGTVSDIKAGKTDVTLNKNFNGDIEAKSIALGGNKLSGDTVSASSLTMTVNGRIDATTASFSTITIDMTGYTGETFTIGTADSFTAKLVNLVNVEEGYSYTSRVIDNNLMVISMEAGDTFANATWTQATCPVMYNGQILGWNNNAFNNVVSAINNVADGYTVYLLSDSTAFDILGKNMIIRNDANVNAITIGDISDSTEAVNSLVIDGMVTAGAIGGIESITYKAQDGCYLSGAQIELGEGQVLTIDTKALTYEGTKAALGGQSGNYFKILDSSVTVNGEAVTAANIRLTESSRFKIYETEDGIYLLNMGKVYYDAGYTTETTGTYDDETGDYLIHEVNAFSSSKGTAASTIYTGLGENMLVYDAKNGGANSVSTRDNKDINMIIQGGEWTGTIQSGCNTSDNHSINYDRYVEINGATVTGGTMYLIGAGSTNSDNYAHEPRYNGTVTALVKDSRVVASSTQGFSLTRYAVHNNDVSLTFENSVVGYDVRVTWYGVHAADTTVSLNFINSSFSAEKWIAVTQSNDIAGHIVAHIYGSSFTGSNFRFAANNRDGSMTHNAADTKFYIAGSTISGYAYGGCSGQENDNNATGVKTLYVEANEYGTESYIRCAVMFDQVVIDANATFNGERIMFTTRNGLANIVIDATGYTGGSRIVSHMTNATRSYENLSTAEDAISVTGSDDYIGVRVNAADVAIVSLKSNIYVNADYDESVNGTIINGDLLIYDVTATNDLGNGFSIVEERGNVANVVVTGGEFDDIYFDSDKTLFFADKADISVLDSVEGGTFTFKGAANMSVDGDFYATAVNANAGVALTVDGDFTAEDFVIDVTGYSGGSTRIIDADRLDVGNVTIVGDTEDNFHFLKNDGDLYLVSKTVTDTFYNKNFTSAVDGQIYNGKIVLFNGDGKNAFTSLDDATALVADGSTVYVFGGSYDDFVTDGLNFVFDGSDNPDLKGGAISMKSIDATGSKIGFAGDVSFASGSSISGAITLDFAPAEGECMTVDSIVMAEGGQIYINAAAIDFGGVQLYKVIDAADGISNATFTVLDDKAGLYTVVDEETGLIKEVDLISHYNLYLDTSYTDEISGSVFEATGDILYFGGNAFNTAAALRSATTEVNGGTIFVTNRGATPGALNTSIYGGYGYDMVIDGATATNVYGGQHQGNEIVYGSPDEESTRYVVIKNSRITGGGDHAGVFALDGNGGTATHTQICYSNVDMTIENSTVALIGMAFADEDGAQSRTHMYGDIKFSAKDSNLTGPIYITYGSVGDTENRVNADITFENVTAGNNFWGIRCNEAAGEFASLDYFDTITVNVKDSSFGGFGGICQWGGGADAIISVDCFEFNISGTANSFNDIHGHIYAWGSYPGFMEEGETAILNIGNEDGSAMTMNVNSTILGFSEINIGENVEVVAGSTVMAELGDSKITMDISSSIKSNGVVYADSLYVNADDYEGGDKVVISGSTMAIGSGEVSNYDYNVQIGTKAVVVYDSTVTNAYVNLDMEDGLAFTGDVDALTGDIMVYNDGYANGQNLTDNFDTAKDLVGEDYSIYLVGGTIGEAATEKVSGSTGYLYADGKSIVVEDALFANDVILTSEYSGEIESTSVTLSGGTYNGTVFMAAEDYTVVDAKLYLSSINSDITIDGANDYTETSSVYITGSATVKEIVNVDSLTFNMADGAKELKLTNNFQGNITIDVTDYDMGGSQAILTQASAFDLSKVTMVGNDSGRYSFTNLDGSLYVYDSVNVSNTYVCQEWTATTVPPVYRGSFLTWNKNAFNTLEDGLAAVAEGCAVYLKGGTYGAFTSEANLVITELVTVDGILDASNVTVTIDATDFDFGGAKYIKVLDVAEGSTFGTVNLINQKSSTYLFKMDEDYYLADLSSGNAYYNSSIRDQVKINEMTGEVMILGVNYEWYSMTTAANEVVKGGTLFIDQTFRTNESTLPAGIFDCVITGTSIGAAWHMQPQTNGTITGDLNLLIKDSYIQSNWLVGRGNNYQDERTFNGKINVAIEGCTVGQLDLGIRTVYSQGFKVSIKDSLLTGVFGESDDQAGLSDDSPVRGGTTELSIVNCTVVSGSSHRIALYRPGWDYTANAIITIEDSNLGDWIVGVTGPANNKAPEGTVTVNFAGSTVAQLRGAKCSSDNDGSVSIFAKTLNLYGGESYVAHYAQRFNHLNITVQNETEDQKGTLLVAETLRLQDDNDNVASITIDLTGYTGGSRQVVRTFGTAADQGLRITDMNNGGAMHIVTPTIKGSTEFKGIMGRHAVAIYRDADLQKATYIGSYTADNNADMSYNNQDVLVVGTNAFSDFDEGFARAGEVSSDLYIASGTYTGLSQFNFTGKFEINTGAVLAYGDIETITITGEFVNNGTFTVDPSLFDKTVGYAKVLSATSITGAGKYDSGSDEWKFIRVANDLYIAALQDETFVSADWAEYSFGDKVQGGLLTIGVNAFGDTDTAKTMTAEGGKITIVAGSTPTVFDGGISGTTVSGVLYASGSNVEFNNDVISANTFAGDGTPGSKSVAVEGTTITAGHLYTNEYKGGIVQEGNRSNVTVNVANTELSGSQRSVFGGASVKGTNTILENHTVTATDTKAAYYVGGNRIAGALTTEGDYNLTLNNCSAMDEKSSQIVMAGSLIVTGGSETRTGNTTISINGGRVNSAIYGGSMIQGTTGEEFSSITGNITMSIGGDFQMNKGAFLYGASGSSKVASTNDGKVKVTGDVAITIDFSEGAVLGNYVYAGGYANTEVEGNASITLKGTPVNPIQTTFKLDSRNGQFGSELVSGERELKFTGFVGQVNGDIISVSKITIDKDSSVGLGSENLNFYDVNWDISGTAGTTGVKIDHDFEAAFTASNEFNLTCEGLEEGNSWKVLDVADDVSLLDKGFGDASITFNGEEMIFVDEDTGWISDSGTYMLKIEEETGDLIASLAEL